LAADFSGNRRSSGTGGCFLLPAAGPGGNQARLKGSSMRFKMSGRLANGAIIGVLVGKPHTGNLFSVRLASIKDSPPLSSFVGENGTTAFF
jgi:hypothetical protein